MRDDIRTPIFFIGMPRSGTTVVFEIFSAHDDVAWLSQYVARFPSITALAALSRLPDLTPSLRRSTTRPDRAGGWGQAVRVGPAEAYEFWERCCGKKFRFDYLLETEAARGEIDCVRESVAKVMRYQGKSRFVAKITGPGRIRYLSSIFPDARFVHLIRDGRAVVESLMRVGFWHERDWMHVPAWRGGLLEADIATWEDRGRSPLALAAVQWRHVLESTREEAARIAPQRYAEVHYERFVSEPDGALDELAAFCGLRHSSRPHEFLHRRIELRDMNYRWRERFDADETAMLDDLLGDTLLRFGYQVQPPGPSKADGIVDQPFAHQALNSGNDHNGTP